MRFRVFVLALALAVILPVVPTALAQFTVSRKPSKPTLKTGDPAPPFTVTDWLKGGPEDLASGRGKKIYVIDFWASWCFPCIKGFPHLTALQKKYASSQVVVIGMTSPGRKNPQRLDQVKKFVSQYGNKIGYTMGWDQTDVMWANYMDAAGKFGIPHAFVIDKKGRIAWEGPPGAELDRVVDKLVLGTYDLSYEVARLQNQGKIKALLQRYNSAVMSKKWPQAAKVLKEILVIDPAHEAALARIHQIYRKEIGDPTAVRAWVEAFIDANQGNSQGLTAMAKLLLSIEAPADRLPDLLLRAARGAFQVGGDKEVSAITIYAQAAHRVGDIDEAIRLQTQAVKQAAEFGKTAVRQTLKYYQTCRKLRDSKLTDSTVLKP